MAPGDCAWFPALSPRFSAPGPVVCNHAPTDPAPVQPNAAASRQPPPSTTRPRRLGQAVPNGGAWKRLNVPIDHLIHPAASRVLASTGASAQRPAVLQVPLATPLDESGTSSPTIYPAASRVLASTGASAQRPAVLQVPLATPLDESGTSSPTIYPAASRVLASTGASAQRPAASQVPLAALLEESVPLYHLPDPHCLPYRSSRGTSSPPPRAATAASSGSNLRKPLASRGGHRPEETAPPLPSSLAARPPLPSTSLSVKGPRPRTPRRDPIVGGIRPGHAGLPDLGCAAPRRRSHPRERLAGAGPPSCRSDVALWQLQAAEACGGTVRRSRAEAR